jgi:hypothetical protein
MIPNALAIAGVCAALALCLGMWTYIAQQVRHCEHLGGVAVMAVHKPLMVVCVHPIEDTER